jgi:ferric-chelate reductase
LRSLLADFVAGPTSRRSSLELGDSEAAEKLDTRASACEGGGLAVCAAGPEVMTREASNAVARIALTQSRRMGGIAVHTETYAM